MRLFIHGKKIAYKNKHKMHVAIKSGEKRHEGKSHKK